MVTAWLIPKGLVSLNDFHDGKELRDEILYKRKFKINGKMTTIKSEERRIRKETKNLKKRDKQIVDLYNMARKEMTAAGQARYDKTDNNRMYAWKSSGAKGNWNQISQMTMAPLLVQDPVKRDVPVPITKSFGEGLPLSQYWASLHGARKGTIDRASGTSDPGALTKDLVNTVIGYHITMEDCRTKKGVLLPTKEADVEGRVVAQDIKLKDGTIIRRGVALTTIELSRIKNSKINQVVVRSSLQCEARKGICQKCFGLNEKGKYHTVGTNIGTIAGHAIGEPVTQMQMRTFHTGGVGGDGLTDYFQAAKDLFNVPQKLRGAAVLSTEAGTITAIKNRMDGTGGKDIVVNNRSHFVPSERAIKPNIRVGYTVKSGEALTDGRPNPHDILNITGSMPKVRNHITGSLMEAYAGDTRRRNVETVIKAMTNITRIQDPQDEPDIIRGQYMTLTEIEHRNKERKMKGQTLIKHKPELKPMNKVPLTAQEDFLARLNYQRLQDTYQDGAAQMWSSDIHGHPISGIAHGAEFGYKLDGQPAGKLTKNVMGQQQVGGNSPFNSTVFKPSF